MGTILQNADPAPINTSVTWDDISSGPSADVAFANGWTLGPAASFTRALEQGGASAPEVTVTKYGPRPNPSVTPLLTNEEADAQYGIPGQLSFGLDRYPQGIRQGEAELLHTWKTQEIERSDALRRASQGFGPGLARFGAGLAATALDPINIGASFIPVVGEARFASLAGRVGLVGARALRGAAEGAVGVAAAEPISLLQAQNEQSDYSAYDALTNITFGVLSGALLHVGVGALADRFGARPIKPEDHATALAGAVAAIADDRPVLVAPYLRMASRRDDLMGGTAVSGTLGPDFVPGTFRDAGAGAVDETVPPAERAEGFEGQPPAPEREVAGPPKPQTLFDFIGEQGGIKDETALKYRSTRRGNALKVGGELEPLYVSQGGARRSGSVLTDEGFTSLVNSTSGKHPDEILQAAIEAGFLPERSTLGDLYDAIARQGRGSDVFSERDAGAVADWRNHEDTEAARRRYGEPQEPSLTLDEAHHRWASDDLRSLGEDVREGATGQELKAQLDERLAIADAATASDIFDRWEREADGKDGRQGAAIEGRNAAGSVEGPATGSEAFAEGAGSGSLWRGRGLETGRAAQGDIGAHAGLDTPEAFERAWSDMVEAQRQSYGLSDREGALIASTDKVAKNYKAPVTLAGERAELDEWSAYDNALVEGQRKAGNLSQADEIALAAGDRAAADAQQRADGIAALGQCLTTAI